MGMTYYALLHSYNQLVKVGSQLQVQALRVVTPFSRAYIQLITSICTVDFRVISGLERQYRSNSCLLLLDQGLSRLNQQRLNQKTAKYLTCLSKSTDASLNRRWQQSEPLPSLFLLHDQHCVFRTHDFVGNGFLQYTDTDSSQNHSIWRQGQLSSKLFFFFWLESSKVLADRQSSAVTTIT